MGTKCGATRGYRRRQPEDTVLYRVVAGYLETFLAGAGQGNGMRSGLPRFVERELRGFLDCGILARGFCRVHCTACGRDALVAFSCKRRGFCPACGTRRMVDTAAHLADRVFPEVPVRQWVLALPYLDPVPVRVRPGAVPGCAAHLRACGSVALQTLGEGERDRGSARRVRGVYAEV